MASIALASERTPLELLRNPFSDEVIRRAQRAYVLKQSFNRARIHLSAH